MFAPLLTFGYGRLGTNHGSESAFEARHEISYNVVCATSKGSEQLAHKRSLIKAFSNPLNIIRLLNQLTEHHLDFLSFQGGCISSSESTLVKMSHCWESDVAAHVYLLHNDDDELEV